MKKDYTDDSWVNENEWKYGKNDELGAMNQLTDASVLKAIALIKKEQYMILKRFALKV